MNEASIVSLTAALRSASVRSSQHEVNAGDWLVLADSTTAYTMTQLVNLESAHSVSARTDRAEFGPATAAQLAPLEAALKTSHIEYRSFEKTVVGEWYLLATSGVMRTVAAIQALEAAHSITARTTRAEFK